MRVRKTITNQPSRLSIGLKYLLILSFPNSQQVIYKKGPSRTTSMMTKPDRERCKKKVCRVWKKISRPKSS